MNVSREAFIERAGNLESALRFENYILSIAREFLPDCVLAVLDGCDPDDAYWQFLVDQLDKR